MPEPYKTKKETHLRFFYIIWYIPTENPEYVGLLPWAVNEARTRDPQLGKLVLYQLSYYRIWADTRTRTGDLFITNELLYQLSHIGLSLLIANGALSQMRCKGSCFFDKHQMFSRFYSLLTGNTSSKEALFYKPKHILLYFYSFISSKRSTFVVNEHHWVWGLDIGISMMNYW